MRSSATQAADGRSSAGASSLALGSGGSVTASERLRLVCASANPAKVAEIAAILGDAVELLPRPASVPVVVEDAGTLQGNARLKATSIATATGLPSLADDTGLEVAALDGLPGVDTATFAGPDATDEENWGTLLSAMADVDDRGARFRTVAMVVWPDGTELLAEGTCNGAIVRQPRGNGGFGYDSVFQPDDGDGRTFAEMTRVEKQAISHRAKAFTALVRALTVEHHGAR
jgi:XTP/dITP diphosphohydrolase